VRTVRPRRLLQAAGLAGLGVAAIGLAVAVGGLVPTHPVVAGLVALGILAFGLTLADAAVIPLLAVLPLFVSARVTLGTVDVSWSDVALTTAFVPAVLLGRRPYSAPLRQLLWLTLIYQIATLFTVLANPYAANTIEWFHAWLLTAGALIVGWTIGREGHARAGLSLVLIASVFLAVACIVQGMPDYLRGDFSPVFPSWPFPMHKNFAGCILGVAAALAYARPTWMGWTKAWSLTAFWVCVGGILATQSRQSLVALALVLIVLVLKRDPHRQRSKIILVTVVPTLALVGSLVRDQLASGNQFNSAFQRLAWFQDSVEVWSQQPWVGVGLRWWYTDRFAVSFQPPNAEMEVLSSSGVVGLVGFVILMLGALVVLWRMDPAYGTAAVAVLGSRFLQGQLDLFWVAAQTSIPFMVVGVCLGAHALHESESRPLGARPSQRPLVQQ
jgi:polysaccharide biosynthesis protein PslJ